MISYNSAISACEKGQQWGQALSLLPKMRRSRLEPNVISYSSAISACEKGQQWEQASNSSPETRRSRLEPTRDQPQLRDQRPREGPAVGAGLELVARDAALLARAEISYSSAISACEKGQQWEQALNLLPETCGAPGWSRT